jgi:hypothetical protein
MPPKIVRHPRVAVPAQISGFSRIAIPTQFTRPADVAELPEVPWLSRIAIPPRVSGMPGVSRPAHVACHRMAGVPL